LCCKYLTLASVGLDSIANNTRRVFTIHRASLQSPSVIRAKLNKFHTRI
jgi:hypothetical protein